MHSRHLEQGGMIGPSLMIWMQSLALDMQQSHQLQLILPQVYIKRRVTKNLKEMMKTRGQDQSVDKPGSSQSSPSKKEAKCKSPLKKVAKLKKRAYGELLDAAIEKVTAAQHASDVNFLKLKRKD